MNISWLTAFIDLPEPDFDDGLAFWAAVTDTTPAEPRGKHQEFATLLTKDGDAFLRVQRLAAGAGGVHLDLHVDDVVAFAWRAVSLGATEIERPEPMLVLLRSPGGLTFCVVGAPGWRRPMTWPGIVDQVCLDVSPSAFADEAAFWAALTMWQPQRGRSRQFEALERPEGMPLRLIFQRLDDEGPTPVGAHLDLAAGARLDAVVERHLDRGAHEIRRTANWVTLRDPVGREYCITRRDPSTGLLTP